MAFRRFIETLTFRSNRAATAVAERNTREGIGEVPVYPPFISGFPVYTPDQIVATQAQLIDRIRDALGLEKKVWDELFCPMIGRLASYMHLLPASRSHHHKGAGGLFHHALDVAYISLLRSEAEEPFRTPFSRESNHTLTQKRMSWRASLVCGALLHDIGKPFTDIQVTNKDGDKRWEPFRGSLYDWAVENRIDKYYIHWLSGRHKRHEGVNALLVSNILGTDLLSYLSSIDAGVLADMLAAVSHEDHDSLTARIIRSADSESTSKDLANVPFDPATQGTSVPVERYVIDAIRRLAESGEWKVNRKGAPFWYLEEGLFIAWTKNNVDRLIALLKSDGIKGIPRAPMTIAEILVDRNIAIPCVTDGGTYPTWEVAPSDLVSAKGDPITLRMLLIGNPNIIFDTGVPVPKTTGTIGGAIRTVTEDRTEDQRGEGARDENDGHQQKEEVQENNLGADIQSPLEVPPTVAIPAPEDAPSTAEKGEAVSITKHPNSSSPEVGAVDVLGLLGQAPGNHQKKSPSKTRKGSAENIPPTTKQNGHDLHLEKLRAALRNCSNRELARALTGTESPIVQTLWLDEDGKSVLSRYPGELSKFGEPAKVVNALFQEGVLVGEMTTPRKKVYVKDGEKAVKFNPGLSKLLIGAHGITRTPPKTTQTKNDEKENAEQERKDPPRAVESGHGMEKKKRESRPKKEVRTGGDRGAQTAKTTSEKKKETAVEKRTTNKRPLQHGEKMGLLGREIIDRYLDACPEEPDREELMARLKEQMSSYYARKAINKHPRFAEKEDEQ